MSADLKTPASAPAPFSLRSAALSLIALVLASADVDALAEQLEARRAATPEGLFDDDAVALDLSRLREQPEPIDFLALIALLRRHGMLPVAVRGGSAEQMAAARAAGLAALPEGAMPLAERPAPAAGDSAPRAAAPEPPAPVPAIVVPARSLIVDKPLRSGQQVYARGADLVVLAVVNDGAEVIADGSIHVYGPLRGRAIAGARGQADARIYATCMEPQIVSIAGTYRTAETPLPADVLGKPAQVRLVGDRIVVEALRI